MRYRGRKFSEQEVGSMRELISGPGDFNRAQLSRMVCEALNWRRADGKLKEMACRVAMLEMERDGIFILPPPRGPSRMGKTLPIRTELGECGKEINCRVGELRCLRLEVVESPADKRLWAELVDRYHYLKYTPLGGAQVRYLIRSEEGVLGCMGWSAAAWKTRPRDEFIGWTIPQREKNLEKVINNGRYLILPWVKVHSLASKVLSMAAKRLADDWESRYGYRPVLLETFVEKDRFLGTCYKAANWIRVGETLGRGRYDRFKKKAQPIKSIWLYPLSRDFRNQICR